MRRLFRKFGRKTDHDVESTSSRGSSRPRRDDVGGMFEPGHGYDPEREAALAAFVLEYSSKEKDEEIDKRVQKTREIMKATPRDPWIDAVIEQMRETEYAEKAYVQEMPGPITTKRDTVEELAASLDISYAHEMPLVTEIPLRKLATIAWPFGDRCTYHEDRICSDCAEVRLERLMIVTRPDRSNAVFELAHVKRNATIPGCPMCRLLLSTFRNSEALTNPPYGDLTKIQAQWDTFSVLVRTSVKDGDFATQSLAGGRRIYTELINAHDFKAEKSVARGKMDTRHGFHLIDVPRKDRHEFSYFGTGRLLEPVADTQLLKTWIESCLKSHGIKCQHPDTTTEFQPGFQMIDVEKRCVVDFELPRGNEYLALSYVWGQAEQLLNVDATRSRLTQEGGLADDRNDIPRTIRDAMLLCQKLGYRFLWVDALCIRQDDKEDKGVQIANMDAVYSRATLTIVAACGTDCNHGLPGVRANGRVFHPVAETVGGITLAPIACQLRPAINSSVWDSRGWTLQEKLLSRRLLIVTDSQIFWRCSLASQYEDARLEGQDARDYCTINDEQDWPFLDDESKNAFHRYRSLALSYVHRSFSHEQDGLDAVLGITKKLGAQMNSKFYGGIPEKYFDVCVLWDWPGVYNQSRLLPRLTHFPSWSWISLIVPDSSRSLVGTFWSAVTTPNEYFDSYTRMLRGSDKDTKVCTIVRYYRYTQEGEPVRIESEVLEGSRDVRFQEYMVKHIRQGWPMQALPFKFWSTEQEFKDLESLLRVQATFMIMHEEFKSCLTSAIGFWGLTTSLFVEYATSTEVSAVQRLAVSLDADFTKVVGRVALDSEWRAQKPAKLKFVAVARHVSNGPHIGLGRTEGWFFHCLLIDCVLPGHTLPVSLRTARIFHRKVAVMFNVHCDDFDASSPEYEPIVLV